MYNFVIDVVGNSYGIC